MAAELASKAIQPFIFVILARLLTPEDYGVVAAAIMVISFTQIFWEAGMSKALIQRQGNIREASDTAFWINVVIGSLVAIILFIFSDFVAIRIFNDVRVAAVLQVMTIQIFLGAVTSVHTALLQKEMKFNLLFWIRLTTVALPALFSIPLALYGFSYWALVIGTLVGQVAQVIALWKISAWRPTLRFSKRLATELWSFGYWVGISGLLSWFYIWIDSLFVGAYLGTHDLGIYRTGNQFVIMIYGFLFTPLLPVLYSHFSTLQDDTGRLRDFFFKAVRIITLISVPLAFVVYTLAYPISVYVFGDKWHGIEFVIQVMALMHGFSWVVGTNGEVYRAIGKPSYETFVNSSLLLIYLLGYYLSIKDGFDTFVWTRYLLSMIALVLHLFLGWKAIRLPVLSVLRLILLAVLIGLVAPILKFITADVINHPLFQILFISTGSLIIMGGLLFTFERNGLIKDLAAIISRRNAIS